MSRNYFYKMKSIIGLLVIFIVLSFGSCKNITQNIIPDKNKSLEFSTKKAIKIFKLSSLVKKTILIPLSTTDTNLIGQIKRIKFNNNSIYILDSDQSKSLSRFSMDGNLISIYHKEGKGPNEYIRPYDFDFASGKGDLTILADADKLIHLNIDLLPINDTWLKFRSFHFIYHKNRIYHQSDTSDGELKISNFSGKLLSNFFSQDNHGNFYSGNPFSRYQDEAFFIRFNCDTIYKIIGNRPLPYRTILDNQYGSLHAYWQSNYYEVFNFTSNLLIYNKSTRSINCIGKHTNDDILNTSVNVLHFFNLYNDQLVGLIEPVDLLKSNSQLSFAKNVSWPNDSLFSLISITSNPIIFIIYLKLNDDTKNI